MPVTLQVMLIATILFLLGLCLGSFVNALVWRIHEERNISTERSMCPKCGHQLAAHDLIPVLSWLILKARCRYCAQPISIQYPLVELTMAVVFVASYYFWPGGVIGVGDVILFGSWLLSAVGLMSLAVYDLRWMILPSKILYLTLAIASAGRLAYIVIFSTNFMHDLVAWILSIMTASGLFFLIFMISSGKWIGYGDVRLGLVTGTLLADPQKAFLMIFIASLLGTIYALPTLMMGKNKLASKVPFGPFLICATFIVILFGSSLINWYNHSLLNL